MPLDSLKCLQKRPSFDPPTPRKWLCMTWQDKRNACIFHNSNAADDTSENRMVLHGIP